MSLESPLSAKSSPPFKIPIILGVLGFTATVAQIVLLRELMVVCSGNELSLSLMLSSWLLWTAAGSILFARFTARSRHPARNMVVLLILLAVLLPATVFSVCVSRGLFGALPNELLGPAPILLICFCSLSCFCAVSGCAFVCGSRLLKDQFSTSSIHAVNSMYRLEATGSALGGILTSVVLLRFLDSMQIALLVSTLSLVAAAALVLHRLSHWLTASVILLAMWTFAGVPGGHRLQINSLARLWPGFQVLDTRDSVYGNLAVIETGGVRSLLENGLLMFSAPDPASAEESVHFALLEHPAPRKLFLIGGGAGGALQQALQHPTLERVEYVELDPAVLDLADQYFFPQWGAARADPRVRIHHADGRLFLKSTSELFDTIIVNLPAPQTAQVNRFYTVEFFREAKGRLADGGVFSFQLHAAEEYLSPDLSAFLRCVLKSLQQVFPVVKMIPGDTVHFAAAKRPGILAEGSSELIRRLQQRHLTTFYVSEYNIPFRMMPDRMADLEQSLRPQPATPVNRDLAPIAYYFGIERWSAQFNRGNQRIFDAIGQLGFRRVAGRAVLFLLVIGAAISCWPRRAVQVRGSAGICAALTGLTVISVEVLLLLGFQALYGYVYHRLAIVIAVFMSGMALGSWYRLRPSRRLGMRTLHASLVRLAIIQIIVAISPMFVYFFLNSLGRVRNLSTLALASEALFPTLALCMGVLGGYEFAVATEIFFVHAKAPSANLGMLYGWDLIGACLGALLLSGFLIPLFGFLKAAVFIAALNLVPALLAARVGWVTPETASG